MCDFESNILRLLREEKTRLTQIFTDKDAPYMKSLEHGIKSAEKKLEECQYKKCIEGIYKANTDILPALTLHQWTNIKNKLYECNKIE